MVFPVIDHTEVDRFLEKKRVFGKFPVAWGIFSCSRFVVDEVGGIQYKDKMHIDWLNDFLGWAPILLMVLVAVVFLVALRWRSGRLKKSLEEWKRKMVREADAGHPAAQFRLGRIYQKGNGVDKDPDRAEEWFHKALPGLKQEAEAGDRDAAFYLYDCFHEGLGVQKDDAEALRWLQRAATEGKTDAMFALALEYREGGLVEKNEDLFMHWLRKAAQEDNRDAQYLLGACYEHGNGVPRNLDLAQEWYDRAAEKKGSGVDDDLNHAPGK